MGKQIYTSVEIPGMPGEGFMFLERISRLDAIQEFRRIEARKAEIAAQIAAIQDDELIVQIVRGVHRQDVIEDLPANPT